MDMLQDLLGRNKTLYELLKAFNGVGRFQNPPPVIQQRGVSAADGLVGKVMAAAKALEFNQEEPIKALEKDGGETFFKLSSPFRTNRERHQTKHATPGL